MAKSRGSVEVWAHEPDVLGCLTTGYWKFTTSLTARCGLEVAAANGCCISWMDDEPSEAGLETPSPDEGANVLCGVGGELPDLDDVGRLDGGNAE